MPFDWYRVKAYGSAPTCQYTVALLGQRSWEVHFYQKLVVRNCMNGGHLVYYYLAVKNFAYPAIGPGLELTVL